jgi:hypothetical protein
MESMMCIQPLLDFAVPLRILETEAKRYGRCAWAKSSNGGSRGWGNSGVGCQISLVFFQRRRNCLGVFSVRPIDGRAVASQSLLGESFRNLAR